jgi:predicted 2-oxoglutarate/Fe(II)-dependent dioxygenase YbiX
MSAEVNWYWRDKALDTIPVPKTNKLPFVLKQLVSPAEADEIYFATLRKYSQRVLHTVYLPDGTGSRVDTDSRYTHSYPYGSMPHSEAINTAMNALVADVSMQWFNKSTRPVYAPQILGYEEKCLFRSHCDNSVFVVDKGWVRNDPARDVSGILYLSEPVDLITGPNQYRGGELCFNNLLGAKGEPIVVRPKKGQMLIFPSSPAYLHEVRMISQGYRLGLVNWWTVQK